MLRAPVAPPLSVVASWTVIRPSGAGFDWVSDPVSWALNGGAGMPADAGVAFDGVDVAGLTTVRVVPTRARTLAGVPARLAHPAARGPDASQPTSTTGLRRLAASPVTRGPRWSGQPTARRHQRARITAATEALVRISTKPTFVSLPAPRPC